MTPRALAPLLVLLTLAGCATMKSTARLDDALAAWDRGDWQTTYDLAAERLRASDAQERQSAQYLAGLAAYRLGDADEAELRLRVAAEGGDRAVAARAEAMLGVLRLEQGRGADAEAHLREAALVLDGDDADQARRWATAAATGASVEPVRMARASSGATASPAAFTTGRFTLQAGAFRDSYRASRMVDALEGDLRRNGVPTARIVVADDGHGRSLHFVQCGAFDSRREAEIARRRIGRDHLIVTLAR